MATRPENTERGFAYRSEVWRGIRGALIFFVLSVVACAAMILGASAALDDATAEYGIRKKRLDQARTRYLQLDEEMATVDAYLPRFRRLAQTGFLGEERRLTWIEALRNAAERLELPELRYHLSPRQSHSLPDFPIDTGPYRIHASEMQLTMGLLHEGDLFSLLAELDRHALGLYSVTYCRLRRVERESWDDPARANLNAECVLRWYSLEERALRIEIRNNNA